MKKTILHIINNLSRGGAERMLVTVIRELREYNNIIVTLDDSNAFEEELECDKYICLSASSRLQVPYAALKLRRVIQKYQPDIVHSHLYWPTLIARIATPDRIPLITTIHAFVATSLDYEKAYIRWLDKLSYRLRKTVIVAVAKGALKEYFSLLKLTPYKAYAQYTFVDVTLFNNVNTLTGNKTDKFRLITIGTLKEQKNHAYLINAFKQLKNENFELDIYGIGFLQQKFEHELQKNGITNISLKGLHKNIHQLIQQYDLFVMSSKFEGFSLAVLEAMAMQMPMLLSDIDSFREQCENTAEYFSLDDPEDFIIKLKQLAGNKARRNELGCKAKERVLANFTLAHHMAGMRKIYSETIND